MGHLLTLTSQRLIIQKAINAQSSRITLGQHRAFTVDLKTDGRVY